MALDVWFKDDIKNSLLSVNQASGDAATIVINGLVDPRELRAYRAGFRAALVSIALAFGIDIPPGRKDALLDLRQLTERQWQEIEDEDHKDGTSEGGDA